MPTVSKKTGFTNPNYKYHEIVKVSTKAKFNKKHGAMEVNLKKCLEIFFDTKFKSELSVYEIIDGTTVGKPYKCDYYAKIGNQHVIFEFNGNHHYQSSFKIDTDTRKNKALRNPAKNTTIKKGSGPGVKYETFKIPYYMQLTKDFAHYLFEDQCLLKLNKSYYSNKKYKKAIKLMYNTDDENMIFAPGLHTSKQTPATYCEEGLERFLKEMDEMSKKYPSIKHQYIRSLKLYIKDVGNEKFIIPLKNGERKNPKKEFTEWFNIEPEEKYLNCIFEREKKVYKL
jgi:hypothetical protein|tara:strand:- start:612 stop:1460 length:849 start_codon:yes stop_codon:yes gene_type:complete